MSISSTADSSDPSKPESEPDTDPRLSRRGSTHSGVEGEASPRLPHEHDESSDSGTRPPDPKIQQAATDVSEGKQPTDRSEESDPLYQKTLRSPSAPRK